MRSLALRRAGPVDERVAASTCASSVDARLDIVDDIGFAVARGRGARRSSASRARGKTTVAMALLGVARPGTRDRRGLACIVGDVDLLSLDERELRAAARATLIAFVPQNPAKALSPGMRIGRQVAEMLEIHARRGRR